MEDEQIIELYQRREERAIAESDKKYGGYCYTLAHHILENHEDTEECVNDTWLHSWNSIPPQKPRRLLAFFAKITRHLAIDTYRKKTAEKRGSHAVEIAIEELQECIASNSDVEADYDRKALEAEINHFLHSIPKRDCHIFIRRYFSLESTEEIAKHYGIRSSNVLLILSRSRKKLKEFLSKEGYIL